MIWKGTLSLAMLLSTSVHADDPIQWKDSPARAALEACLIATAEFETTYTVEGPWVLTEALDPGHEYRKASIDELLRLGSLPDDYARREIRTRFSRGCFLMELVPVTGAVTDRVLWNGEKSYLFTVGSQAGGAPHPSADPTSLLVVDRTAMSQFNDQLSPHVFLAVDRFPGQSFLRDRTLLQLLDEADVSVVEVDDRIIIEAYIVSRAGSQQRTQRLVITMEADPGPAIVRWELDNYAGDPRLEEGMSKLLSRLVMTHDAFESFGSVRIPSSSFVWIIPVVSGSGRTTSLSNYVEYRRRSIRLLNDAESAELREVPFVDPETVLRVQDLTLRISYQTGERWVTVDRELLWAREPIDQVIGDAAWVSLAPTLEVEK